MGVAGCGESDSSTASDTRPTVVVTANILGDVVQNLVGADVQVEVLMPVGVDPHEFSPSARQAADMRGADALVVTGRGLEAGLGDAIDAAEGDGVPVVTATDALPAGADDPHLFSDPVLMRQAARLIADQLAAEIPSLDTPAFAARVTGYLDELAALDAEVRAQLAVIPPERRLLVTNHEVFGYFAERYDFEVLGALVPGSSTLAQPSAADMAALADLIAERHLPAIFADTSAPSRLVDALAAEGSGVAVVELYTESVGPAGSDGDTYVSLTRTNAARISAALA